MLSAEGIIAAVTCFAVVSVARHVAQLIGLGAQPGGRHIHLEVVPVVGGLGIAAGFFLATAVLPQPSLTGVALACAAGVFMLGCADDWWSLRASHKLWAQCVLAGLAAAYGGLALPSLGQWLPGLNATVPALAIPIAVLGIVALMNAVNMADGMDGMAGTLGASSFLFLAWAAWLGGARPDEIALPLIAFAALAAFLLFNARWFGRSRAAVFMGDAGSLFIGFLLAALAIHYSQVARVLPPAVAFWICSVPLFDGLVVILRRRLRGAKAMTPDCDHLHHLLLRRGHSVNGVVAIEAGLSIALASAALLAWRSGVSHWVLIALIPCAFAGWWGWTGRLQQLGKPVESGRPVGAL
jgi:UDP-GlcNAc:undecaprenyl-phosphate/decaprenyl-phosphate GlcNAc-1-phosphate transferase